MDFASVISGKGAITNDMSSIQGVTVLNGVNTYTGVTSLGAGTLSVATIGNGGVAGNLGAATNAAANLSFFGTVNAGLQYTGVTASTDRSFTIQTGRVAVLEVTNSATNLTFTGGSAATIGAILKAGPGTLTFAGSMAHTGAATLTGGTLALDYTASNLSKLSDTSPLIFFGARSSSIAPSLPMPKSSLSPR